MWIFVVLLCLLDQNQAATLPWEPSSLQLVLQQQATLATLPPATTAGQQKTSSSSSSSSSSSASSESSQSSEPGPHMIRYREEPQLLRERQNLENPENTAVEQLDSSQEGAWLSELVLLGDRAGRQDRGGDTGDDSEESSEGRQRALLLTFQHLLSRPRRPARTTAGPGGDTAQGGGATTDGGGATTDANVAGGEVGVALGDEGVVGGSEPDAEFPRLSDDSSERDGGLTLDSPGHAHHHDYHGNEEGLELGL